MGAVLMDVESRAAALERREWISADSWIAEVQGTCTCTPYGSSHQPSCGEEPLCDLATVQDAAATAAALVEDHNTLAAALEAAENERDRLREAASELAARDSVLRCELTGDKGGLRCAASTVAARFEDGFIDYVCEEHALSAEARPRALVIRFPVLAGPVVASKPDCTCGSARFGHTPLAHHSQCPIHIAAVVASKETDQ